MIKTTLQRIYVTLIFIFLYAPIVTLIVLSFNASKTRAKWGGFTTKWYTSLFQNEAIMNALANTLLIAFAASIVSTLIVYRDYELKEAFTRNRHGNYEHSHAECRNCHRHFPDAALYQYGIKVRSWHNFTCTYYLLHSLRDFKHYAENEAIESLYL